MALFTTSPVIESLSGAVGTLVAVKCHQGDAFHELHRGLGGDRHVNVIKLSWYVKKNYSINSFVQRNVMRNLNRIINDAYRHKEWKDLGDSLKSEGKWH